MDVNIFWFRRDLRLHDNAGLYHALKGGLPVVPLFIFDTCILDHLDEKADARVSFIFDTIQELKAQLNSLQSDIIIRYGKPEDIWSQLTLDFSIRRVFTNEDYDGYSIQRDKRVSDLLQKSGIHFHSYKDHVIFAKNEVIKPDSKPYSVFTPYKNKWIAKITEKNTDVQNSFFLKSYPSDEYLEQLYRFTSPYENITLKTLGFKHSDITIPPKTVGQNLIKGYDKTRDFPGMAGTSRLGIHYRFGTISIREKARHAAVLNMTYLNELIWRDFYNMILFHFPHVKKGPFRPEYESIHWRNNEHEFELWKNGLTGYPIVDAGMRELLHTGYMHNRVRMITASFLTKHLLIDWRWGEAWFAQKLLDYDLASNNGGWQWAAGCGTDAAPYFRIFSPEAQTKKFDPDLKYIKTWIHELDTPSYPRPVVDHSYARERCLQVYKEALNNQKIYNTQ